MRRISRYKEGAKIHEMCDLYFVPFVASMTLMVEYEHET